MRVSTVFVLAIAATGCEPTVTDDLLALGFDQSTPIVVDVACAGESCASLVSGALAYSDDGTVTDPEASVEILQYRVDYDMPGDDPDFFAAELASTVTVALDGEATVSVVAAGTAQRAWWASHHGDTPGLGAATVTLGGYDAWNRPTYVSGSFPILFTTGSN